MKKLKLNLSCAKELNRAQQRSINGGSGSDDSCVDLCNSNSDCGYPETDEKCYNVRFESGCEAKRCLRSFN